MAVSVLFRQSTFIREAPKPNTAPKKVSNFVLYALGSCVEYFTEGRNVGRAAEQRSQAHLSPSEHSLPQAQPRPATPVEPSPA